MSKPKERLAEAATDLYKALEYLVTLCELEDRVCRLVIKDDALKAAVAALKKARGES